MSSLTAPRDTKEYVDGTFVTIEAGGTIYPGAMVAINGSGKAVTAADATGLKVVGRAENYAESGDDVKIRIGIFGYDNDSTNKVVATDVGKPLYVVDDHTVSDVAGTYSVVAGICRGIDASGEVIVEHIAPCALGATAIFGGGQSAAIADLASTPTAANVNAILAALRKAGIIAAS